MNVVQSGDVHLRCLTGVAATSRSIIVDLAFSQASTAFNRFTRSSNNVTKSLTDNSVKRHFLPLHFAVSCWIETCSAASEPLTPAARSCGCKQQERFSAWSVVQLGTSALGDTGGPARGPLDAFPREKQGVAMTLFGLAVLLAPVIGPTLGGWITDEYSWRWVFFINIPIGLLALAACYALLRDPEYLVKQREELKTQPFSFDAIGLSLLVIVMVCWEVMLSKGQEWDWLSDPFWRVQTLAIVFTVGLIGLIVWELRHPSPVVDFRPLRERNFSACCLIIFCAYAVLYASSTSLPRLLQSLFGYDALNAGLVLSPAGVFALIAMPVAGRLLGWGTDARWLIATGLLLMAAGSYWMSQMNLDISPGQVAGPEWCWCSDFRYASSLRTWRPTSILPWRCGERPSACSCSSMAAHASWSRSDFIQTAVPARCSPMGRRAVRLWTRCSPTPVSWCPA